MNEIWQVLVQFVFRLTFGMALCMAVTPSKLVTAGFYRVHLWVLMGLNTFAALAALSSRESMDDAGISASPVIGVAIGLAVASYIASVIWLYEEEVVGGVFLYGIALVGLVGAAVSTPWSEAAGSLGVVMGFLELVSSGMLLGATMAAMLLGHWYLNTPSMALLPLKRLVQMMIAAAVVRTVLAGAGLWLHLDEAGGESLESMFWVWIAARWVLGLLGAIMMGLLAWYTLKVPNTQSATGILYAGVIVVFMGELFSQLLSVGELYPL